jgi:hypothetical protein
MVGQAIESFVLSDAETTLDISSLNPGVYWINIKTNEQVSSMRFVKQ